MLRCGHDRPDRGSRGRRIRALPIGRLNEVVREGGGGLLSPVSGIRKIGRLPKPMARRAPTNIRLRKIIGGRRT